MEKFFEITGTFSITITVPADSMKEAKHFAAEYFPDLVHLDVNQLDKVIVGNIKPVKRFKVIAVAVDDSI
jgi:hypothetical protein